MDWRIPTRRHTLQWKSTVDKHIRDEVHFDMQPTHWPTKQYQGHRQLWTMEQAGRSYRTTSSTRDNTWQWAIRHTTHLANCHKQRTGLQKVALPKFQTLPEVTCVYGIDGKCSGTIIPQRLSILQDAYNSACHWGANALLCPPVQYFATELQGLLHRLPQLSMTGNHTNLKADCSHYRALPTRFATAFRNHALVTKERMTAPLDFSPERQEFWTASKRQSVWFQDRRVLQTVNWILHLPPDVWR